MSKVTEEQQTPNSDDVVGFDTSDERVLLDQTEEGWDDLNNLKDDLAVTMLEFVNDIESITSSPELLAAVGDKRGELDRNIDVFYHDIDKFTATIQTLRAEHENFTGGVKTMEELNIFTRVSMGYQALQIELQSLLGPTMSTIVLLIHEAAPALKTPTDEVTDVEVKE